MMSNRYFHVDDGGCDYYLVARDREHARSLLLDAGVEFVDDDGVCYPLSEPATDLFVNWVELTPEQASLKRCHLNDNDGNVKPLSECDLGDWFSSEW